MWLVATTPFELNVEQDMFKDLRRDVEGWWYVGGGVHNTQIIGLSTIVIYGFALSGKHGADARRHQVRLPRPRDADSSAPDSQAARRRSSATLFPRYTRVTRRPRRQARAHQEAAPCPPATGSSPSTRSCPCPATPPARGCTDIGAARLSNGARGQEEGDRHLRRCCHRRSRRRR